MRAVLGGRGHSGGHTRDELVTRPPDAEDLAARSIVGKKAPTRRSRWPLRTWVNRRPTFSLRVAAITQDREPELKQPLPRSSRAAASSSVAPPRWPDRRTLQLQHASQLLRPPAPRKIARGH